MSLKDRIQQMAGDSEEIHPDEFSNLILDDIKINQVNDEDKAYLNKFLNLEKLCMNSTGLTSLTNLPNELNKIARLELTDNSLEGSELPKLLVFAQTLQVLKIGNNKIQTIDEVKQLAGLTELIQLDIQHNPITNVDNYRQQILDAFPKLEVLDGKDRDGGDFSSNEDYGEEGEMD